MSNFHSSQRVSIADAQVFCLMQATGPIIDFDMAKRMNEYDIFAKTIENKTITNAISQLILNFVFLFGKLMWQELSWRKKTRMERHQDYWCCLQDVIICVFKRDKYYNVFNIMVIVKNIISVIF